ncbi:hypothetical protein SKAU_G00091140 [Synaphobranchus kaupii]|uniref:Uncharacterized protein n=1 Tax=Synaphobranchus kaupii TaxID=118154 RepID=A0A9Q1FWQ0_SYNKA|nr:hypothetical protein SKAU_G00091140 [Synaphobranchus kaupii]
MRLDQRGHRHGRKEGIKTRRRQSKTIKHQPDHPYSLYHGSASSVADRNGQFWAPCRLDPSSGVQKTPPNPPSLRPNPPAAQQADLCARGTLRPGRSR